MCAMGADAGRAPAFHVDCDGGDGSGIGANRGNVHSDPLCAVEAVALSGS